MRRALIVLIAAFVAALGARDAGAIAGPGDVAPDFTKDQLDYPVMGQTTPTSLSDYLGQVVLIFELGYG